MRSTYLLVDTGIPGLETIDIFGWSDAALIRLFELQRQELLHAELVKQRQHLQLPSLELPVNVIYY